MKGEGNPRKDFLILGREATGVASRFFLLKRTQRQQRYSSHMPVSLRGVNPFGESPILPKTLINIRKLEN